MVKLLGVNVTLEEKGSRWILHFPYNKRLKDEVKAMKGAQWHPKTKAWSVERCARNVTTLRYLMGKPVFDRYDRPLEDVKPKRNLYSHQLQMLRHFVTRRRCIIAGDPGTGKTLPAIELMELMPTVRTPWFVAPDSAIHGVTAELHKWNSSVMPRMMSYDYLKRVVHSWPDGEKGPDMVIFDEFSRCKGWDTQRSHACEWLAHSMLDDWGDDCWIIGMTGTPAPNVPTDWWMECEIICPGFLRESSYYAAKRRLSVSVQMQGLHGNYPKHVQWRDGGDCVQCLQRAETVGAMMSEVGDDPELAKLIESIHGPGGCTECNDTGKVRDEVSLLGERMSGLVLVKHKKDCLDLPDKIYRRIQLKVPADVARAADLIENSPLNALEKLTRLRQLSDGFQYPDGKMIHRVKLDAVKMLLDEFEESERLVFYACYTASIDALMNECHKAGWATWRYDGRGCETWDGRDFQTAYRAFGRTCCKGRGCILCKQKMVYIAHPETGGMSLTLHTAPAAIFYSNDFKGESRRQAEDRVHRMGMDENRSPQIIDLMALPTDELILDRLDEKARLELLTTEKIKAALRETRVEM